jgi:rRNA biogenesis protein RRP5
MTQLTSVESVLPGLRVRALVTGVQRGGLNVQALGYFAGTIDLTHLGKVDTSSHKVGEKVDARILWDIPETNPRQIALSMLPHVLSLSPSKMQDDEKKLEDTYPVGTILEGLKVVRVEADRGVVVAIGDKPIGFTHVSAQHFKTIHDVYALLDFKCIRRTCSDAFAASGLWKIGTVHRGRIIGHSPLDALLHLSFKQSVLDQKFFKATDVQVGQMVKGTVHSLTDSALFVAISGNMHAVVWPNHFADIRLKHPERKFKVGSSIKCRVGALHFQVVHLTNQRFRCLLSIRRRTAYALLQRRLCSTPNCPSLQALQTRKLAR